MTRKEIAEKICAEMRNDGGVVMTRLNPTNLKEALMPFKSKKEDGR